MDPHIGSINAVELGVKQYRPIVCTNLIIDLNLNKKILGRQVLVLN